MQGDKITCTRRELLGLIGASTGALLLPRGAAQAIAQERAGQPPRPLRTPPSHPYLNVTRDKIGTLRSLGDLRQVISRGHGKLIWDEMIRRADVDLKEDPWPGGARLLHRQSDWCAHH